MTAQPLPPRCARAFCIVRPLGAGGQGTVYLAVQVALERPVAIKLLLFEDPELVARFRLEAQVAARIDHPNVVRVIDHDVEDGQPWIAYELVEGPTLREQLAGGALSWTVAAQLGAGVARGLAAAHAIGAVHRDVKPENVLLGEGGARLADFGLAIYSDGSGVGTRPGVLLGTPAYMAPEVVLGQRADAHADVYALGVVLHEMLTGRPPFEADRPVELLRAHVSRGAPDFAAEAPDAPRALRQLVLRCLAKDKIDRPTSAAAVAAELEALVATSPASGEAPARTRAIAGRAKSSATRIISLPPADAPGAIGSRALRAGLAAAGLALVVGLVASPFRPAPFRPAPVRPPPVSAPPGASPMDFALAPLEERVGLATRDLWRVTAELRVWEVDLAARVGAGTATLGQVGRLRDAIGRTSADLDALAQTLADGAGRDLAADAVRVAVDAARFDAWFWRQWVARYFPPGQTELLVTDMVTLGSWLRPAEGGRPLFRVFSTHLFDVIARAGRDPEACDRRVADALASLALAYRALRAEKNPEHLDPKMFDDMKACATLLPRQATPLAIALGELGQRLAASATTTPERLTVTLIPELRARLADGRRTHPDAAAAFDRLARRVDELAAP